MRRETPNNGNMWAQWGDGATVGHNGDMGTQWGHRGATMRIWGHHGVSVEMLWGCCGGHMGSLWDHCGDAMGAIWGPYGVTMGSRHQVALRSLPEEAVKETLEYKVLQSQFSLLYHESLQVKTQLDEARALLLATKNSHLRHIEHMEVRGAAGGRGRGPQDGRRGAEVNGCWVGKMADWGLSNMADWWAVKMAD